MQVYRGLQETQPTRWFPGQVSEVTLIAYYCFTPPWPNKVYKLLVTHQIHEHVVANLCQFARQRIDNLYLRILPSNTYQWRIILQILSPRTCKVFFLWLWFMSQMVYMISRLLTPSSKIDWITSIFELPFSTEGGRHIKTYRVPVSDIFGGWDQLGNNRHVWGKWWQIWGPGRAHYMGKISQNRYLLAD